MAVRPVFRRYVRPCRPGPRNRFAVDRSDGRSAGNGRRSTNRRSRFHVKQWRPRSMPDRTPFDSSYVPLSCTVSSLPAALDGCRHRSAPIPRTGEACGPGEERQGSRRRGPPLGPLYRRAVSLRPDGRRRPRLAASGPLPAADPTHPSDARISAPAGPSGITRPIGRVPLSRRGGRAGRAGAEHRPPTGGPDLAERRSPRRALDGAAFASGRRRPHAGTTTRPPWSAARATPPHSRRIVGAPPPSRTHRGLVLGDLLRRRGALERQHPATHPGSGRHQPANRSNGATARAVTTSAGRALTLDVLLGPSPDHRDRGVQAERRTASARNAVRRANGSTEYHRRSGRAIARTIPGSPAPDPTSTTSRPAESARSRRRS